MRAGRFEHDGARLHVDLAALFGDDEAVVVVADDHRRGVIEAAEAGERVLQHRRVADQAQKLLRIQLSRQRPKARAGAASQNYR